MKQLITFDNGKKIVAEAGALVLPYPVHQITEKINLDETKPDKILQLEKTPDNDKLLKEITID